MKLNVNPIYKLIAQGEHQQQDFKFCINDSKKIARSLVAFANTDGGRLLIGVKDNGKIIGVSSDEEYYMAEAAAKIYSRPKIEFTTQQWDVDGKIVLEIDIEPSSHRPHYAQDDNGNWIAYIRKGDENVLANSVLLRSWEIEKKKEGLCFSYDEPRKRLIEFLNDNKTITLSKFARIAQISRNHAEYILAEFLSMKYINIQLDKIPVTYSLNHDSLVKNLG